MERLHVGGGQAGGVGRGEEVAEAVFGQVAVLVVVEGLSRELAEEVGAVQEATGAAVSLQGTVGGCQGLGAAAAAEAAADGIKNNRSKHFCPGLEDQHCQLQCIVMSMHHRPKITMDFSKGIRLMARLQNF